jgi:RNA polymerase-associated protein CTR9
LFRIPLTKFTFSHLLQAKEHHPKDGAIAFNLALVQQKGLELLVDLPPSSRTLAEIRTAIADAQLAQE